MLISWKLPIYFDAAFIFLDAIFLVAFLVKGKAFLRLFSIVKAFLFSLFQEESKHITSKLLQFVDALKKGEALQY